MSHSRLKSTKEALRQMAPIINMAEAARKLGVSRQRVQLLARRMKLPVVDGRTGPAREWKRRDGS